MKSHRIQSSRRKRWMEREVVKSRRRWGEEEEEGEKEEPDKTEEVGVRVGEQKEFEEVEG